MGFHLDHLARWEWWLMAKKKKCEKNASEKKKIDVKNAAGKTVWLIHTHDLWLLKFNGLLKLSWHISGCIKFQAFSLLLLFFFKQKSSGTHFVPFFLSFFEERTGRWKGIAKEMATVKWPLGIEIFQHKINEFSLLLPWYFISHSSIIQRKCDKHIEVYATRGVE